MSGRPKMSAGTLLACLSVICGSAQQPSAPTLIAHWSFDAADGDLVADQSGHGNQAELLNGASLAPGKLGQALALDGVDDLAQIPHPSFDGTGDLSVAAWIYPDSRTPTVRGFVFGSGSFSITFEVANRRLCVVSELSRTDCTPFQSVELDRWQHVVVRRDAAGGLVEILIDGSRAAQALNGKTPAAADVFAVGNHPDSGGKVRPFGGLIDEVRVYQGLLADSTIRALQDESAFDFSLEISSLRPVAPGGTASLTLTLHLLEGLSHPVELEPEALVSGVAVRFEKASSCTPPCSLRALADIPMSTPPGTYPIAISGAAGSIERAGHSSLVVAPGPPGSGPHAPASSRTAGRSGYSRLPADDGGALRIERIGETGDARSAPQTPFWRISGATPPSNPQTFSNLPAGAYQVHELDAFGLVESVGICTYPAGAAGCIIAEFSVAPDCDGRVCSVEAPVEANSVTRVVYRYQGVYEGFAANATGGRSGIVRHVSNLRAGGPGSLRAALQEACEEGNRYIVFDVGGDISAGGELTVCGKHVTIDGFTAPSPVTLRRTSVNVSVVDELGEERDAENIIIRGLRIRKDGDTAFDKGVVFASGGSSYQGRKRLSNVVFAHNSVSGATDDMVVLARQARDISLIANIFSNPLVAKHMYLQHDAFRVSILRNVFSGAAFRVPAFFFHNPPDTSVSPELNGDVRNNLIGLSQSIPGAVNSTSTGTIVARGSKANVINNLYVGLEGLANNARAINNAVIVCNPFARWANPLMSTFCGEGAWSASEASAGGAYVDGNVVRSDFNDPLATSTDLLKTKVQPYPTVATPTLSAEDAACQILADAAPRALDSNDQAVMEEMEREVAKFVNCR